MVPFSFPQPLLKSRVMKERSWPSSPLAGAKPLSSEAFAKEDRRRGDLWLLLLRPTVVKKFGPASRWLKKPKLPNEPNLKTAPPAISASREG
jgi:hypothetical protein